MSTKRILLLVMISLVAFGATQAQQKEWTLAECIDYALSENIDVRKAGVSESVGEISLQQARDNRWPSVSASVGENFGWQSSTDTSGISSFTGSGRTSFSVSSGVTLFSGFQVRKSIERAELNYQGLQYSTAETRESVSLNIMYAYLQVLYAEEQLANSRDQAEATGKELALAAERYRLGAIANSDYLQVKTQLASDEATVAAAVSTLEMAKITLMQLMELPVDNEFDISRPDIDAIIASTPEISAVDVYQTALEVKPQVKNAELNRAGAVIDMDIAKGGYYPTLSASAGMSSNFAEAATLGSQLKDNFTPSVGLSLSIPIFQNNQNKSSVAKAKAAITTAELDELYTRNQLRKEIEQACFDVRSSVINYQAALNQYEASKESYLVAEEKFKLGAMNSVDFLIQKTSMTAAESSLLQSRYDLVYCYKIIDFYKGEALTF